MEELLSVSNVAVSTLGSVSQSVLCNQGFFSDSDLFVEVCVSVRERVRAKQEREIKTYREKDRESSFFFWLRILGLPDVFCGRDEG